MERYFVSQFDADTFVVVDQRENREVCTCSNYEEWDDGQQRALAIAALLNLAQSGAWN